ncbi:hypothetical protein OTU49_008360 [Cherax quadricarinatus]|uniref:Uncharacterized protein n=2 Tax=Cherax quadricarinatus TaxID=27406 RepID=A0AAW0WR38_CHEQU
MKFWLVFALFGLLAITVGVHAEEGTAEPEPSPEGTAEPSPHESAPSQEASAEPTPEPAPRNESSVIMTEAPSTEARDSTTPGSASQAGLYLPSLLFSALVLIKFAH